MKKTEFGARRVHSPQQAGGTSRAAKIFAEEQNYISPGFQGIALYAGLPWRADATKSLPTRMASSISTSCQESALAAWVIATHTM